MYRVNTSGKSITFKWKEQKFFIHGWEHVELPEEMYDFIEEFYPKLEMDYERYLAIGDAYGLH